MIRSGKLSYSSAESPLFQWEPGGNGILSAFLIAALTTLLSYQLISVTFNLLLGIKPRHKARISDIHILVLVRNLSPIAVLSGLFRVDRFTRWQFGLPPGTSVKRDERNVSYGVAIKLLVLLLIAPLANVIAVILALENDTVITLGEADFGGVVLGVADAASVGFDRLTEKCNLARVELQRGETTKSDFFACDTDGALPKPETEGQASVTLVKASNYLLGLEVSVHGMGVYHGKQAYFRTVKDGRKDAFHIPVAPDEVALSKLVDRGIEKLAERCGASASFAVDITDQLREAFVDLATVPLKGKSLICPSGKREDALKVMGELAGNLTLVSSQKMRTFPIREDAIGAELSEDELEISDMSEYPLFTRRRRNLSLWLMIIGVGVGVIFHAITSLTCHDDVDRGVGVIIKKALGLRCCDSGLWEHGVVIEYETQGEEAVRTCDLTVYNDRDFDRDFDRDLEMAPK